jgi:hypothetical protein
MSGKLSSLRVIAAAASLVLLAAGSVAQEAKAPTERELRTAMNRAENRFFELYNRVNEDARHKLSCENQERSASRLRGNRTCRTQGESDISADAAREYLRGMNLAADTDTQIETGLQGQATGDDSGGPLAQVPTVDANRRDSSDQGFSDAGSRLREERSAFEKHLATLTEKHPELKQRLDEYLAARVRYETARRR